MERIAKEEVVICFKVATFQCSHGGNEENKRKPYSGQPAFGPTTELGLLNTRQKC
jgi:hypothetical protein